MVVPFAGISLLLSPSPDRFTTPGVAVEGGVLVAAGGTGPAARLVGRIGHLHLPRGPELRGGETFASLQGQLGVSTGANGALSSGAYGVLGLRAGSRGVGWEAGGTLALPFVSAEALAVRVGAPLTQVGVGARIADVWAVELGSSH
ncbi:MAG: hypothetical protein H6736_19290 [Alphaproteobacteria bacterium]|nr:hypothetical protein [Alphaproteobacteria bacterium]